MKILFYCLIALSVGFAKGQELKSVVWKNRVVILFGNPDDKIFGQQETMLKKAKLAITERDILVWHGTPKVKKQLNLDPNFKGLVLIGKDGGIKLSRPFIVPIQELFALIDAMPMRRSEMRGKK